MRVPVLPYLEEIPTFFVSNRFESIHTHTHTSWSNVNVLSPELHLYCMLIQLFQTLDWAFCRHTCSKCQNGPSIHTSEWTPIPCSWNLPIINSPVHELVRELMTDNTKECSFLFTSHWLGWLQYVSNNHNTAWQDVTFDGRWIFFVILPINQSTTPYCAKLPEESNMIIVIDDATWKNNL